MATATSPLTTKSDKCEKPEHSDKPESQAEISTNIAGKKSSSLFDNEQEFSVHKEDSVSTKSEELRHSEEEDEDDYYDYDDDDSQMQIDESSNLSPPETVIYPPLPLLTKDQIKPEITESYLRLQKRRETNRRAAQKCRQKQTEREAILRREFLETESRNTRLNYEILQLRKSKELLEEILRNHYCVIKKAKSNSTETSNTESSKDISSPEKNPEQRRATQPDTTGDVNPQSILTPPVTPVEISSQSRTSQPISPVGINPQGAVILQSVSAAENVQKGCVLEHIKIKQQKLSRSIEINPQVSSSLINTFSSNSVATLPTQALPFEILPHVITPQPSPPLTKSPLPITVINVEKNPQSKPVQMEKQPVLVSKPISIQPETYSSEIPTFVASPSAKLTQDGFKIPQSLPKKVRPKKGLRQINAEELKKILKKGGKLLPVRNNDMDKGISLKHNKLKAIYSQKPSNKEGFATGGHVVSEKRKMASHSITKSSESIPDYTNQVHEEVDTSLPSKTPKTMNTLYHMNSLPITHLTEQNFSIPTSNMSLHKSISSSSTKKFSKEEIEERKRAERTSIAATALLELNQHGLERVHSAPVKTIQAHPQSTYSQIPPGYIQLIPHKVVNSGSPQVHLAIPVSQHVLAAGGISDSHPTSNVQVLQKLSSRSSQSTVVHSGQQIFSSNTSSHLVNFHPGQQVYTSVVHSAQSSSNSGISNTPYVLNVQKGLVNSNLHSASIERIPQSVASSNENIQIAEQTVASGTSHSRNVPNSQKSLISDISHSENDKIAQESTVSDISHSENVIESKINYSLAQSQNVTSPVQNLTNDSNISTSNILNTTSYITDYISPTKITSTGPQYMKRRDFHHKNELRRTQNEAVQEMLRKAALKQEHSDDTDQGLEYRSEQKMDVIQNDGEMVVQMNK